MGTMARTAAVAGTATAVSGRVRRRSAQAPAQQEPAADQQPADQQPADQQPADQQPADPQPADQQPADPASELSSRLAVIKQLDQMRAQGLLTEEEFATQKSKVLNA
jgi:hypothetical protein